MKGITYSLLIVLLTSAHLLVVSANAQAQQQVEFYAETGHTSFIESLAFSKDGKLLASGGADNTIKLWDVSTGNELKTFLGHVSTLPIGVTSVQFSPDSKTLFSSGGDCKVRVWDVASGRELRILPIEPAPTECGGGVKVILSPDGRKLAFTSGGNSFTLWDLEKWQPKTPFEHLDFVSSLEFSRNSKVLASAGAFNDRTIKLWNVDTGQLITSLVGADQGITSLVFSPDGTILYSNGDSAHGIIVWDVSAGKKLTTLFGHTNFVASLALSPNGKTLASSGESPEGSVKLWDTPNRRGLRSLPESSNSFSLVFSPDGEMLATTGSGGTGADITLWDISRGLKLKTLSRRSGISSLFRISPNGKVLAWLGNEGTLMHDPAPRTLEQSLIGLPMSGTGGGNAIKLLDLTGGLKVRTLAGHTDLILQLAFSEDGTTIASGGDDHTIRLWDVLSGQELRRLPVTDRVSSITFSLDGKTLISGTVDNVTKLWDVRSGRELRSWSNHHPVAFSPDKRTVVSVGKLFGNSAQKNLIIYLLDLYSGEQKVLRGHTDSVYRVDFSPDGKILVSASYDMTRRMWDVATGQEIESSQMTDDNGMKRIADLIPNYFAKRDVTDAPISQGRFQLRFGDNGKLNWYEAKSGDLCATLVALDENDLVVATPDGRFDTNKSLDRIDGLHWILNEEVLNPIPVDVFMRQYYEPGLLQRSLKCSEAGTCDNEFKRLPPIAEINRVQPAVAIKEIKTSTINADLVDVTIEIRNVSKDIRVSATDKFKKKSFSSGAFDLRLFRDGQLVGVTTPKNELTAFINASPQLVAETKASNKLIDTPEDRAWREANDLFTIRSENLKIISLDKVEYTFRNIKLPHDGRKEVEFTTYVFNSDRVKSATTEPFKFTIPPAVVNTPRKGRAVLVSIGVNASENPAYNLRYAVNDAHKMQEVVGERLKADSDKYSEVIQIPLVSDYGRNKKLIENTARKDIIKGVFSLLAGHEADVPPDVMKLIPNRDNIKPIEPEDTLIITYSGHGYADQEGVFYLLPYDIGRNTTKLMPAALQKTISSDELSLWMLDITAAEMIMIIDACHSAAAIEGEGFKPGPMGSRGLGQLAYDKNMKVLAATQADNVALESNRLSQGLLSYALLEDGILRELADSNRDKQLSVREWLSFAEARVPQLYDEIRSGKRSGLINNQKVNSKTRDTIDLELDRGSNRRLQNPHLFDFGRNVTRTIFTLP